MKDRGTITPTRTVFGHRYPITIRNTADMENVSPPLSWSKLSNGTQSLVLVDYYHVTESPINQNVNNWYNCEVYYIPTTLYSFYENL